MQKIVIKYIQKVAALIPLSYLLQCLHSKLVFRMGFEILQFSLRQMTMLPDNILSAGRNCFIVLLISSVVMSTTKSVFLAF